RVEGVLAVLAVAFMIELSNVSKIYLPNAAALKGISLQIERGECVFVIGASGVGKTTLLKLLCCDEEPSEGQKFYHGKELIRVHQRRVAWFPAQIGFLF